MIPIVRERVVEFIKKYPMVSPPLTRFPIPDTFWNAGTQRIFFRLFNHYLSYSQMLSKKSRIFGYPSHLFIDPTNVCNLRCPLCPTGVGAPSRPRGMMPLATFKKIVDETGRYLVSVDLFNWGEPLLNKDIFEMIAYAHRRHIVTSISSNFNHFPEGSAEKLISSGLDILILSIDGASQESYAKYRVGGDFAKVQENVALLVKKKRQTGAKHPYIFWQFLVMKHNEHEMETAKEVAATLGVDQLAFDHAYLPVATRVEAMQWLPQDPKYHRYNLEELEQRWQAVECDEAGQRRGEGPDTRQEVLRRRPNCSWLWTQAAINCDGSVSPCCAIFDLSGDFGNVTRDSFRGVWNNEKYRASRKFSATGDVDDTLTVCMKCPLAVNG